MKIKFLKPASGAVNGIIVKYYNTDDIVSVNGVQIDKALTEVFLQRGIAEIYKEQQVAIEEKQIIPEIENKAIVPTRNKKGK